VRTFAGISYMCGQLVLGCLHASLTAALSGMKRSPMTRMSLDAMAAVVA